MYALATFFVVAAISLVFSQFVTGALIATGTPREVATFQARSAFSGAGFTTIESENVVNHPVRRRIISVAMFGGSLGIPTLVVTVMVGLIAPGPGTTTQRTLVLIAGLIIVIVAVINRPATRLLQDIGHRYAQGRLLPRLEHAAQELVDVGDGHVVVATRLGEEMVTGPRSLRELDRAFVGVTVLGVRRNGTVIAESPTDLELDSGDELIMWGTRAQLVDLGLELPE